MDGTDQIYQGPDGTALRFFERPVKNNFQSEKHGRPIFDTQLLVEVMVPGSRESTPEFEVERVYNETAGKNADGGPLVERGPKYDLYRPMVEAYKAQNGQGLAEGTPLSQWPNVDVGTVATLKAAGIHTVEMLAGVQDTHLHNLGMGGRVLRDQAQAFINTRQFGVPSMQMASETAKLREENARLTAERDDLTQRLSQALGELGAAKTGQPAPPPAAGKDASQGSATMLTDPLGSGTISSPNPFADMSGKSASPLTPSEGQADKGAEQAAKDTADGKAPALI